ncbi:MAG: Ig-like domain-containing protein [Candidatus Micrarchaeota archaeon]|nr:Ig-like domain-containing protein [Candidatus Micrarchaeota archaeon]
MDNKAIIIIVGLLFLLASTSAFVVNIKGDTLYNPAGEGVKPAPNGLSVYPQVVPRYCDITVTSAPNKQVKVYARNYIDTGLGCKTNSNGVCTFRFSSAQPQGTYYVSGNGLQVAVVLDPSAHCAQEISSLYFQQDNVKVAAGVPYIFNTSAYAPDGSAVVPKPVFSLVNASIGTLSYPDYLTPNQVQFVGSLVGTTKIIAEYSGKVATATVTVTPGRCNVLKVSKPDVAYTAGTNATILISTTDRFGNTKSNIEVLVKYAAPDGTVIEKSAYSNEAGKAAVGIPVGTRAGTGRVLVDTKPQLACPDQKSEYYFSVIPSFPASVAIVPQSKTLNVHDMERFKAYVYDEYGNEIKDVNITWESSDASIVSIDSAGVATANRPGSAAVTATVYYDMIAVTPQCAGVFCVPVASLVKVPVSGSAQVTVLNGKADRIVIQPVAPTVVAGGTQQFTATLYDEFNAVVPNAVFTWSATNGTITQGGLYTAPTKTGVDIVNVSSGAVRASTQVTIINGPAAAIKAYSEGPRAVVNTRHVLFANVTDAFGNPVSNVLVNYELLSGDVAPASGQFTTQQDGMGAFVVTAGPTEGKAIYKMAVDGTSIQDDDFFEVYIPDIVLSGVVTDYYTQQPVDGVLVRVEGTQYSATTNATGHYIINGIAQGGKYNVTFSKAGYRSERTEVSLLKDNEDNNYTLNAEIRVYTQVSGTVRNESGSLMQGVNVTLYEGNAYLTSALTDAQGRYAFSIAPGRGSVQFTVTASAPGYDSASAGTVITPGVPVVINLVLRGYDTVPPIIMFVGQTPPDGTYQGGTFTVMTLASDPHYSSTVITVVSGASRSQVASCATQACSASITGGAFPDGAITVIATANDTRGNTASIQNNYYLDYVAPAVTFVAPTPADGSTLDKPFIINVSASDSTGVKKVEIAIVAGGSTVHTEQCAGASVCTYLLNNSVYNGAIQAVATAYSELKSSTEVRAFTVIPPKPVLTSLLIAPSSSSAYVGDTVTITAKALDEKGRPMQNVPIDFTASGGSVPVQHTVTNASGDVRVQYQFQSAGTYTITANSSALSNSTSVTISEVPIASVQLAAVPSSLLVGQVSTVTATVLNARGQPVPNARVSFASSGGIILPSTAATDANGRAVAQFVSLLPGTYEINATVGALRNSTSVLVSVIPPASITVVAVPSEMRTGQTSVVTATVRDALGQPISGATVSFASDGGTIAPLSALTDANGRASAQFSAPVVGVYKVNATVGTITASTNINVNAGSVPTQLRLVASPQTILTVGSSDIVVRVVDQYGDGLPHQQVTFVSSGGTLSAQSAMTNATGYATVKFSAAQVGTYQVNATSGQLANSTYVQVMAVPVATSLTVQASPASVPAGVSSTITATVRDQYGAPMAGQAVQFSATGGSIAPQSAVTGQDGRAVVQFISNAPATYTITAVSGALTNTTAVTVTQPSGTGVLSGTVTDASGAPVQGANVSVMKSYTVLFSTLAGPGGAYSFNIPADTYDIVVEAQGYLPVRDYGVRVLDGGTTVKNYQLTKLSRLYGYVLNSTGSPVAGATLKAYRNGNLAGTAVSQANGAYEFKLAAGVYVVETTHPSYQRALYTVYLPPTTELAKDVTLYR